jgi:hypothetical protein
MSTTCYSYTVQQLLTFRPQLSTIAPPAGLLKIVLNGTQAPPSSKKSHGPQPPRRKQGGNGGGGGRHPPQQQNSNWTRPPSLQQSENSFSVARRRKKDQSESDIIVGEVRSLLNKVTTENVNVLKDEIGKSDAKLYTYAKDLQDDDKEELLMEISKLFVRKAQFDHEFGGLYASLAHTITQHIDIFGDILYEVCRETIPTTRYDVDKKSDYIGALMLLIELRRVDLITSGSVSAPFERLIAAIDRCDPNTIFSVQNEGEQPVNPAEQTELCIELICKVLPIYLATENPEWVARHLQKLRDLQQQKDRIKPRSRFMLVDFFKQIEKLSAK